MGSKKHPIERVIRDTKTLPSGCWEWTASRIRNGYGKLFDGHKNVLAHRWVYEYFRGSIPPGFQIDHLCSNRACVNPSHMEPVTNHENIQRGHVDWRKYLTHCKRGHEYTPKNTKLSRNGTSRSCRACVNMKQRERRRRQ